jgi:hypothetical protein
LPVCLKAGANRIRFGNDVSYPPDLDRIVIRDGMGVPAPSSDVYEAESATLGGTVTAGFSNYFSGLAKAGNIGGGAANGVTFSNVSVPRAGVYQLEIDYATKGPRSLYLSINGQAPTQLDLDGSSFDDPVARVLEVPLRAGANTIQLGNASGFAPDLDRIVVSPRVGAPAPGCP